jgi:YVTN family beta-propeller protein
VEEKPSVYFKSPLEVNCSYCLQRLSINVVPSENRLQDIVSSEINGLRQEIPDMKLIELNATALGGNHGYKLVYSYDDPIPTKVMESITLIGDKAYYIIFQSDTERYYDYLPIIQKMLNSFVIDSMQSVNPISQAINHAGTGIKVANNPFAIAFDSITKMLYVSNTRSNTVSVIDTSRNNIISNITVGSFPYAIALDESQNTIYVANEKSNTISVIGGSTNRPVDTITLDTGPVDMAVNSYADRVYTANFCSNSISVIEASTNTVLKNITLGERPDSCSDFGMGIAVNTFTNMIYVTNRDSDTLYVIDGNTDNIVDTIHAIRPVSVAVNPITNTIYSVRDDPTNGVVDVINGYSNNVMTNFSVSVIPNMIIANPSTNMLYVTNIGSDTLSVINGSKNEPLLNITVGRAPSGVTVDQDTNTLYVANELSNTVSVINGNTDKIMVGVNFNADPLDSGEIYCNDHKIQNNDYNKYDIETELKCEARANNIFPPMKFASWSIIPPMKFESWTSDLTSDTKDKPTATFIAFQHGHLVANFKEIITKDYMNTIFGTVLGLGIPALGGLLYKKREWLYSKFGRQNN